ncbi:MAG: SpoIIIAH-like family protein [Clostridiaceae bacterium]|jgi:stage III sporulation protein AH|nr:SpoIIIAH-like family protein [Clostridiaceae bacterium]
MMVFKRKQIIILALILLIVVAGYLQYSYRQGNTSADSEGRLGEALYVDNEIYNEGMAGSDPGLADAGFGDQVNVTASKMANDYFIQAKLDKEQSRSEAADSLKAIVEDVTASPEVREEAHNRMIALAETAEKESRIEILINKMGFEDSFILFADNGSVDIVVKTPSLTSSQAAQITDIVMRQADVDVEDIHISTMF